jgi:hypothetical protein
MMEFNRGSGDYNHIGVLFSITLPMLMILSIC